MANTVEPAAKLEAQELVARAGRTVPKEEEQDLVHPADPAAKLEAQELVARAGRAVLAEQAQEEHELVLPCKMMTSHCLTCTGPRPRPTPRPA